MTMTEHAHARFKQRQKIKNIPEMRRKMALAVERGMLLEEGSSRAGTLCYLYDGFKYIVSGDRQVLITVFSAKVPTDVNRRRLVEEIRIRQQQRDAGAGWSAFLELDV